MSLKKMLDDGESLLRKWWDDELPGITACTKLGIWRDALAAPPTESAKPHAGVVGTAFDYRVRWFWPAGAAMDLIGVAFANVEFGIQRATEFASEVDAIAIKHAGSDSADDPAADERLSRLSLVLAHLETASRSGWPIDPVANVNAESTLDAMMDAQPAALIDDIRLIAAASRATLDPFLAQPVILNPVFERSSLVGGADGDLIVNGCLLDVKTTATKSLPSKYLRQIVSYALLDDIDEHKIRSVGLLYARRPQLLEWRLDELLARCSRKTRAELSASMVEALSAGSTAQQRRR